MKKITIPNAETFIAAIQDEISRKPEGRYYHRLHAILYDYKEIAHTKQQNFMGIRQELFNIGFTDLSIKVL